MKTFVEKYDTVTDPSGEEQTVGKEMTVQVEQWWNSSDVAVSLREENTWDADGTVAVVGKRKKYYSMGLQYGFSSILFTCMGMGFRAFFSHVWLQYGFSSILFVCMGFLFLYHRPLFIMKR